MRFTWCLRPSWSVSSSRLLLRVAPEQPCRGGSRPPVVEVDSLAQSPERVLARPALDLDLVDLLDAVAGMSEPVRELPVVRKQEDARRVGVEASDGHDAHRVAHQIDDRRPSLRVAGGRHHTGRLVQENVRERLRRDPAAVDLDDVRRADLGRQLPLPAVDENAACGDELVGSAP